jgi:hypothetical protein
MMMHGTLDIEQENELLKKEVQNMRQLHEHLAMKMEEKRKEEEIETLKEITEFLVSYGVKKFTFAGFEVQF